MESQCQWQCRRQRQQPVVVAVVGEAINTAAAMGTVINDGNHLGRWSDCAVQRRGYLRSTGGGFLDTYL